MNPGGGVDQDHGNLAFATLLQEFLDAQKILAGSRVLAELGHALAAVEFLDGSDDCFALRLCLGESNSVCKVAVGNINGGLHDSILSVRVFPVNDDRFSGGCNWRLGDPPLAQLRCPTDVPVLIQAIPIIRPGECWRRASEID